MNKYITAEALHSVLNQVIGKKILKSASGDNTGSIFTMHFGTELVPYERKGVIFYKGEMNMMVFCAWRLVDADNAVITGWHENSSETGPLTLGLKSLTDDVIRNIEVSQNFDLVITTEKGRRLQIFCDLTPHVSMDNNWFFGINDLYYTIDNTLNCVESLH